LEYIASGLGILLCQRFQVGRCADPLGFFCAVLATLSAKDD